MNGARDRWMIIAIALFVPYLAMAAPQCGSSDDSATFVDGMFSLPGLPNAKDAYVIVITQEGAAERIKLNLPAGSTGLRVRTDALPQGSSWSWCYKLVAATPPAITVRTPPLVELDRTDLRDDRYVVRWESFPKAKKYRLTGETKPIATKPSDAEPAIEKIDLACIASTCGRDGIAEKGIPLKAGTEAKWKVSALDEDDLVIAASDERTLRVAHTWASTVVASGFKLQRSDTLNKVDRAKGATFSQVSVEKEGAERSKAYQSEFALIYEGGSKKPFGIEVWPTLSVEARQTSAGKDKASDTAKVRAGFYQMLAAAEGNGAEFVVNLKHETERKTETKKTALELALTPIYGPWCIAQGINIGRSGLNCRGVGPSEALPWIQVTPILGFGADLGKAVDVGTSNESKQTVQRLRVSFRADVELNFISNGLGIPNLSAYYEGVRWYLPREEVMQHHRLRKGGLSVELGEGLSFEVAYAAGREAPAFKYSRTFSAGFGVKFQ